MGLLVGKWLLAKKYYIIIIVIALAAVGYFAYRAHSIQAELIEATQIIAANQVLTKENDEITSQFIETLSFVSTLVPADTLKLVEKRDEKVVIQTKTKWLIKEVATEVPLKEQKFGYEDEIILLSGAVEGRDKVKLDLAYKPITISTTVTQKDGIFKVYYKAPNDKLTIQESSFVIDKTLVTKQRRNLVSGLVTYDLASTSWQGIGVAAQYQYLFDRFAIGAQLGVNLQGHSAAAIVVGGRF